ncbi:MAG: vitamin K epoxide reductase family protein [Patescibacteria group bacterium]
MQKIPKWIPFLFLLFSFAGFLDATYLASKHYLGSPVTCSFLKGCEEVTSSQYAVVFGVSIAVFGALYYLLLLILAIIYFDTKNIRVLTTAGYITLLGFISSMFLVYLQVFVIRALCLYCMMSAMISTILFILGFFVIHISRQLNKE